MCERAVGLGSASKKTFLDINKKNDNATFFYEMQ